MKRTLTVLAVVIAVAALAAVPIFARGRGAHTGEGFGFGGGMALERLEKLREELDLSDAQVAELRSIARATFEENRQHRKSLRGGFRNAAGILVADPQNVEEARAALDKLETSREAIRDNILESASRGLQVLTPEQRTRLAAWIERHDDRGF
jgi:Spy/CpxP family protein refolding chaperone